MSDYKAKRAKEYGIPICRNELIRQTFEIWETISNELKNDLADFIYNRSNEILEKNENQINY
jgi:2-phosphoglycerate kinase